MTNLEFTSKITVELLGQYGGDMNVVRSALVSSNADKAREDISYEKVRGLIHSLARQRHGSPFESGYFEFWIDAPRAVRDEHVRHRIGSYSSSSLRYNHGETRLYVPPKNRPLREVEGFKKMNPKYEPLDADSYKKYAEKLEEAYTKTYECYDALVDMGHTSTESTRWITHDGKMTPYIARFNPRSLMAFLSLRTHDASANHLSFPMWEINEVANELEFTFKQFYPLTWEAWNEYGRESL